MNGERRTWLDHISYVIRTTRHFLQRLKFNRKHARRLFEYSRDRRLIDAVAFRQAAIGIETSSGEGQRGVKPKRTGFLCNYDAPREAFTEYGYNHNTTLPFRIPHSAVDMIGVVGFLHSGKGTFTRGLVAGLRQTASDAGFDPDVMIQQRLFAGPGKKVCAALFDDPEAPYDQDKKMITHPILNMTPRKFMQMFMSDWCKPVMGKHVWTNLAEHNWLNGNIHPLAITVFDDCRYEHEARMISRHNGYLFETIRVNHPWVPSHHHESEQLFPTTLVDCAVAAPEGAIDELENAGYMFGRYIGWLKWIRQ